MYSMYLYLCINYYISSKNFEVIGPQKKKKELYENYGITLNKRIFFLTLILMRRYYTIFSSSNIDVQHMR